MAEDVSDGELSGDDEHYLNSVVEFFRLIESSWLFHGESESNPGRCHHYPGSNF